MRRGRLTGIGVGPGDPELLTVKAARLLESVPVIACIAATGHSSRARQIAAGYLRPAVRELVGLMPMADSPAMRTRAYAQLAGAVAAELDQGNDVAFLCEGDPLFYGSFAHLLAQMPAGHQCAAIPGVTSMSAAAALLLQPLALGDRPLTVLPATLPPNALAAALAEADRVVILKVGRHLAKIVEALRQAGLLEGAVLAQDIGMPGERVRRLADIRDEVVPYFALVLAGPSARG